MRAALRTVYGAILFLALAPLLHAGISCVDNSPCVAAAAVSTATPTPTATSSPTATATFTSDSSKANTTLNNLGSVSINSPLLFQTGNGVGSTSAPAKNFVFNLSGTYGTGDFTFAGTPTGHLTIGLPNASFTVASTDVAQTFSAQENFSNVAIINDDTSGQGLYFGTSALSYLALNTTQTPDTILLGVNALGESLKLTEFADRAFDFQNGPCGTSACTDPTLIGFSHNQNTSQYWSITHDGTNAVVSVGTGRLAVGNAISALSGTSNTVPSFTYSGATTTGLTYDSNNAVQHVIDAGAEFLRLANNRTGAPGLTLLSNSGTNGYGIVNAEGDAQPFHMFMFAPSAQSVQFGANAASPVAYTLGVSGSRSGTDTNVGGGALTIQSGTGTGTGTVSNIVFKTPVAVASGTGAQTQTTQLTIDSSGLHPLSVTFANLGTPANGTMLYCSDCKVTTVFANNACTSGGSGSFAFRQASAWSCIE